MKHNVIRYSMIVLLFGLVALTAGRANAQESESNKEIELLSLSLGIVPGLTTRVSVVNFADGSVRFISPSIARIQILDAEGEMIAQSEEIKVAPGKIRFWDAPHALLLGSGEQGTGRHQVRIRVLVTTKSLDVDRPYLAATLELIDPSTGRTATYMEFKLKEVLISGVIQNGDSR